MTALLFDIGNSRLKWGVLVNNRIDDTGHLPLRDLAQSVASLREALPAKIESAFACNVAGKDIGSLLEGFVASNYGASLEFILSSDAACGVRNAYQDPEQLGVDRWLALIGARAITDQACLVVDAGTAITLDVMDQTGLHLGGQILPGLSLMSKVLNQNTSDLPAIDSSAWGHSVRNKPFAATTSDAISQGILNAVLGAIERGLRSLRATEADAKLILTGGDADFILQQLQLGAQQRPHLVLEGLACFAANSRQD